MKSSVYGWHFAVKLNKSEATKSLQCLRCWQRTVTRWRCRLCTAAVNIYIVSYFFIFCKKVGSTVIRIAQWVAMKRLVTKCVAMFCDAQALGWMGWPRFQFNLLIYHVTTARCAQYKHLSLSKPLVWMVTCRWGSARPDVGRCGTVDNRMNCLPCAVGNWHHPLYNFFHFYLLLI